MAFQTNAFQHNAFQTGIAGGAVQAPLNVSVDMLRNPTLRPNAAGYVHIGANLLLTTLAASVALTYQARAPLYARPIQRAPAQQETVQVNLLTNTLGAVVQAPFKFNEFAQPLPSKPQQLTVPVNLLVNTLVDPTVLSLRGRHEQYSPTLPRRVQQPDIMLNLPVTTLVDTTSLRLAGLPLPANPVLARRVQQPDALPNLLVNTLVDSTVLGFKTEAGTMVYARRAAQPVDTQNLLNTTLGGVAPAQAPFTPLDFSQPRGRVAQQSIDSLNLLTNTLVDSTVLRLRGGHDLERPTIGRRVQQPDAPPNLTVSTLVDTTALRLAGLPLPVNPVLLRVAQQPDIGANLISTTLFVAPSTTPFTPIDLTITYARQPVTVDTMAINLLPLQVETPVVAPPAAEQPAGRHKKRRYYVEIDNQTFQVESVEEAVELLETAKRVAIAPAKAAAAIAVRRALKVGELPRTPKIPRIRADGELHDIVVSANNALQELYRSALIDAELKYRIAKQQREDDNDDDDVLLLM